MTNFEYYKDEILKITNKGHDIAVCGGRPVDCDDMGCSNCGLNIDGMSCRAAHVKWLYEEHVGQPKLTKKERVFCELAESGWISRDSDGDIIYRHYDNKPRKGSWCWYSDVGSSSSIDVIFKTYKPFPFITWDDDEPWSVEDLLKLEVIEEE